jgi:predicted RNA-binding Zn ribbon-like protein
MTVSWTKHRFSGGALVFDTTNTVVHRGDAARSFDRFDDPSEISRFAAAASSFRAAELGGRPLAVHDAERSAPLVLAIREASDRLFRLAALSGSMEAAHLPALLRACAAGLEEGEGALGVPGMPFGDPSRPLAFEAALAVSALSLLSGGSLGRIKICPNCNWLFLDASRNASRVWCDMAVCGNRHKAKRHYHRNREAADA